MVLFKVPPPRWAGARPPSPLREWASGFADGRTGRFHSPPPQGYRSGMGWADLKGWTRDVAGAAAAGLFIGLIGPFGSYLNGSPVVRVAYWVAVLIFGVLIYGTALRLARRAALRWRFPGWAGVLAGAVAAAAPMAVVCVLIASQVWPFLKLSPLTWYLECLVMGLPLAAGYDLLLSRDARRAKARGEPPRRFGREVICLQMEDHYVRVHTALGSELILMRLSDAVSRTGREGLQVHRSWWVASDAIAHVVRDGRNFRLKLLNGLEVPVARRAVSRLRGLGRGAD